MSDHPSWDAREVVTDLEARLDWHYGKMPYDQYLLTAHWRHIRAVAIEHYGSACTLCGNPDIKVNVHHRTYDRRGSERLFDLTVLCEECHHRFHREVA